MHVLLRLVAAISVFHLLLTHSNGALIGQFDILDSSANGGINPVTQMPWKVGDTYRLAFISSTGVIAASGDIATYNDHVRDLASAAGLGTNWSALVSTPTVSAISNSNTDPVLDSGVSVFLTDGMTMVATNNADLWDGSVLNPIIRSEAGVVQSNGSKVYTGSLSSGNPGLTLGGGERVTIGAVGNKLKWVDGGSARADNEYQIYAVSDVFMVTNSIEPIPEPSVISLMVLGSLVVFRRRR